MDIMVTMYIGVGELQAWEIARVNFTFAVMAEFSDDVSLIENIGRCRVVTC